MSWIKARAHAGERIPTIQRAQIIEQTSLLTRACCRGPSAGRGVVWRHSITASAWARLEEREQPTHAVRVDIWLTLGSLSVRLRHTSGQGLKGTACERSTDRALLGLQPAPLVFLPPRR